MGPARSRCGWWRWWGVPRRKAGWSNAGCGPIECGSDLPQLCGSWWVLNWPNVAVLVIWKATRSIIVLSYSIFKNHTPFLRVRNFLVFVFFPFQSLSREWHLWPTKLAGGGAANLISVKFLPACEEALRKFWKLCRLKWMWCKLFGIFAEVVEKGRGF